MSVLGTGIAAGVAQTAQQAEQVARRKDKKARDKRDTADMLDLHALGQEKVDQVDQPEAGPAPEPVGVATDAERGDKVTDPLPPQPTAERRAPLGPRGERPAAHPHPPTAEPIVRAEAVASYEHAEPTNDPAPGQVPQSRRSHLDIEA